MTAGHRHARSIRFQGALGHALDARLDLPAGEPWAWALFAHCFTCHKQYLAQARIGRALVGHGIGVLRFDLTGLGDSEGEFQDTTFSTSVADIVRAADYLREQHLAPSILFGHSLGGSAVLAAAQDIPESRVVATLASPSRPAQILDHLGHVIPQIEREGEAPVSIGGRTYTLRRAFLEDIVNHDLEGRVRALGRALIVFQSPQDPVVSPEHARRLHDWARAPRALVELEGADHLLSDPRDATLVGSVLAAWARRYATGDASLRG